MDCTKKSTISSSVTFLRDIEYLEGNAKIVVIVPFLTLLDAGGHYGLHFTNWSSNKLILGAQAPLYLTPVID